MSSHGKFLSVLKGIVCEDCTGKVTKEHFNWVEEGFVNKNWDSRRRKLNGTRTKIDWDKSVHVVYRFKVLKDFGRK